MNKIIIKLILAGLVFSQLACSNAKQGSLQQIKNFSQVTNLLASAGMPSASELETIQNHGYKHVINLVPDDQRQQKKQTEALQMTFEQIPVDWDQPKLQDFKDFVVLMKKYQHEKVFVHCYINYRASAFAYLYQVTQQGVAPNIAEQKMLSIWQPDGTWLEFINMIQAHYQA